MKKMYIPVIVVIAILLIVAGIFLYERAHASLYEEPETYMQISMAEAEKVFESDLPKNYIILDVRRPDEFAGGHIPGAINLPNEDIGTEAPSELPDKNQTIYIYCRSGNRSKQAAGKLLAMGYSNLIECGGIIDYRGVVE